MKIFYDQSAFIFERYSGIPRYFVELISFFKNNNLDIEPIFPSRYCYNQDYRKLTFANNVPTSWRIKDFMIDSCRKYLHKNPSKLLTNIEKSSRKYLDNNSDIDIFHPTSIPTTYQKILSNNKIPLILTFYDCTLEMYPELFHLQSTSTYIQNVKNTINLATRIICISKSTKNDLLNYYDVDPGIVDVIPLGPPQLQQSISSPINREIDPTSEITDKKYILFVGRRDAHKNFYLAIKALSKILIKYNLNLICTGASFTPSELSYIQSLGIEANVQHVFANNNQLASLYKNALLFIFPSINEGFGLPILEAFSCGCPVICSNRSSFPEIGENAAMYFNPKDVNNIAEISEMVICNDELRKQMIKNGYEKVAQYSWEKCASQTKKTYEMALE